MFRPGSKRLLALNCPKLRRTGHKTSCLWNSRDEWRTVNLPHFGNRDTPESPFGNSWVGVSS